MRPIDVFVIHVSTDTVREKHILEQLKNKNLRVHFVNKGDKSDLDSNILNNYFSGQMKVVSAATSCAYKHILAYEAIEAQKIDLAIIFEDDICLYTPFESIVEKIVQEIDERNLTNYIISLEDSGLKFIKRSETQNGLELYKKQYGRNAGAYIIDQTCAQTLVKQINLHKCDRPIDWQHNFFSDLGAINIYWTKNAACEQGTFNGSFASKIGTNKFNGLHRLFYQIQKAYKKVVYWFR